MENQRTFLNNWWANLSRAARSFLRQQWAVIALAALLATAGGIGGGWLIAELGPLPVIALVAALGYLVWILRNLEIAFWGVLGIVTLLPFAALPIQVGFKPTFLDGALGALFFAWLAPVALNRTWRPIATPVGGPVLAFMLLAIGSFVAGLSHSAVTSYIVRHFAEVLLSIALFYLVVNTVREVGRLERLTRALILTASAAAALGIVLYFLPDELTITLLSALGRFGYPVGANVLRFIRDDPSLMQRATSTSVDPNVLGSLLNVTTALAVPQLFAERPILPRRFLIPLVGIMGLCLGLTISRGSMAGLALTVALLGALRYRKLLPLLAAGVVLILLLPWTQTYVVHFVQGLQWQDLSSQMRLGEYKDALILIRRYPILGVGFGGAPDIDTYIGVSNMYLLIAEEMGLVGLTAFLTVAGMVLIRFWRRRAAALTLPRLEPLWYGLHGAIVGGLIGGTLDHYFFSLDFHHSVTLFWLLIGLATAATELVDAESRLPAGE